MAFYKKSIWRWKDRLDFFKVILIAWTFYYGLIKLKRLLDRTPLLFKEKENGDCHTPFRLVRRSRFLLNSHAGNNSKWCTKVNNDNDCSRSEDSLRSADVFPVVASTSALRRLIGGWKSWQVTTTSPFLISGLTFFSYSVGSQLLVIGKATLGYSFLITLRMWCSDGCSRVSDKVLHVIRA